MNNIVERLRGNLGDGIKRHPSAIKLEAADAIERLRDENTCVVTELVESEAEIERLRNDYSILKADYDALREVRENEGNEIERLRAAVVLIASGGTKYDSAADLIRIARRTLSLNRGATDDGHCA